MYSRQRYNGHGECMTSLRMLVVKYVVYSTAYQVSLWFTGTSTVSLGLVTRVQITFAHELFSISFLL